MTKKICVIGFNSLSYNIITYLLNNCINIKILCITRNTKITQTNIEYLFEDYNSLPKTFYDKYDTILYTTYSYENQHLNIISFINLLNKIENQKFIYFSSAAVYGFSLVASNELSCKKNTTVYSTVKNTMDSIVSLHKDKKIFGLCLGTVNGYPNRIIKRHTNLLIDKIIEDSVSKGAESSFENYNRSVLGMGDLCRVVYIIYNRGCLSNSGIYNISSFNTTTNDVCKYICSRLKINIKRVNSVSNYNFHLDNSKFKNTFNFTFEDNMESIVGSLVSFYNIF